MQSLAIAIEIAIEVEAEAASNQPQSGFEMANKHNASTAEIDNFKSVSYIICIVKL